MEAPIYNLEGKKAGTIKLPEGVFDVRWNADLVKQVVDSLLSSKRKPVAHVKTRDEVRGGGRKPWRQKGTGRARHGSTRSPIWVGGGVTHGPRNEKNFERKVTKKMRIKALNTLLSRKLREAEILFIDAVKLDKPKAREGLKALKILSSIEGFESILSKRKNSAVLAFARKNRELERAFKNFGNIETIEARNLDPLTILQYKYLVMENPKASLEALPKMPTSAKAKSESKAKS